MSNIRIPITFDCEECHGAGVVPDRRALHADPHATTDCPTCCGGGRRVGEVTVEELARMMAETGAKDFYRKS